MTWWLAGSAGLAALAGVAAAQTQTPATIELTGVVRDFPKAHPDFNLIPETGKGHDAGVVATTLQNARPALSGAGYRVRRQWTNGEGVPIAPHLYRTGDGGAAVRLVNPAMMHGGAIVDTWDSNAGPYGGANVGPAPRFETGLTLPALSAPTDLGPSVGNVTLDNVTRTSNLRCGHLFIRRTVQVSGRLTILCEGDLTISSNSSLQIMDGSSLDLYVRGEIRIQPQTVVNAPPTSGSPGRLSIYHLGTADIRISQPNGVVYAAVHAPTSRMRVMPNAAFFGTFSGQGLEVKANAEFHLDTAGAGAAPTCGRAVNDHAGLAGVASQSGISSASTFEQWYRERIEANVAKGHTIKLRVNSRGVYEYLDDAFYPIDGMLLGDEGDQHNYYFTYAIAAKFVHASCAGQFIELAGADDIWAFVNGRLVIDLGGIAPGTEQLIEIDRLGLADGATCTLRIFQAHRHPGTPRLRLRTNIPLVSEPISVEVSGFYD